MLFRVNHHNPNAIEQRHKEETAVLRKRHMMWRTFNRHAPQNLIRGWTEGYHLSRIPKVGCAFEPCTIDTIDIDHLAIGSRNDIVGELADLNPANHFVTRNPDQGN